MGQHRTFSGFCRTCDSIRYGILTGEKYYFKESHNYLPSLLPTQTAFSFVPDKMLQIKYSIFLYSDSLILPHGFNIEKNENDGIFLTNAVAKYPLLTNVTQEHINMFCQQQRNRNFASVEQRNQNFTAIEFREEKVVNPIYYYISTGGTVCGGGYDCNNSPTYYEPNEIKIVDKNGNDCNDCNDCNDSD